MKNSTTENQSNEHISVLLNESIENLIWNDSGVYFDCTFGRGGHTREMLVRYPNIKVIGIDRDKNSQKYADELIAEFPDRFVFVNNLFSKIKQIKNDLDIPQIDGLLYDLGVSSMQIDNPDRGFSFQSDGDLSMQMGCNNISAKDVVNGFSEKEIASILFKYGDEKLSRRIAKQIVKERVNGDIETTEQLANIVKKVIPYAGGINPATRTFQAIRIFVNEELSELEKSIVDALDILKSGGRICVISFHSKEDKIVKDFARKNGKDRNLNSRQDVSSWFDFVPKDVALDDNTLNKNEGRVKQVFKKPIVASDKEVEFNQRSRSAKLRVIEKN